MKKRQTQSRRGLLGFILVVLALSMSQGCSVSGVSNSSLQDRSGPLNVIEVASRSDEPANVLIGSASWYGPGFHGKKTASGELFDQTKLTAAHKTIPLGRKARVTNLTNGKSVEVLINDRGPYIAGRLIDLSQAAAKALGMIDNGIANVHVELLQNTMVVENTDRNGS